jgi:hypothetical protein
VILVGCIPADWILAKRGCTTQGVAVGSFVEHTTKGETGEEEAEEEEEEDFLWQLQTD